MLCKPSDRRILENAFSVAHLNRIISLLVALSEDDLYVGIAYHMKFCSKQIPLQVNI
jgi:hypothetical protein